MTDLKTMQDYLKTVDLTGTRRGILKMDAAAETGAIFDKAKNQAQVVGSGVFSFAKGVTAEVREAISDSALLAQLKANKEADVEADPLKWFKVYGQVLQNLGWTIQEGGWDTYDGRGTALEVHEQVVAFMTAILGPGAAALTIVKATVDALKAMQPGSSWLTIFSRETQKARLARFQIGLVDREEGGDVFVSLLMSLVEAKKRITQVLFIKFKEDRARFRANSGKVSVNRAALIGIGPGVRNKIKAYQADYLGSIKDL